MHSIPRVEAYTHMSQSATTALQAVPYHPKGWILNFQRFSQKRKIEQPLNRVCVLSVILARFIYDTMRIGRF
jgi:hypothetical protein